MARGDDLEERMIAFAVRVVNVSGNLPKTQAGRHIGDQLLRSGTSPAANYAEARRAESKRDFVHKLKILEVTQLGVPPEMAAAGRMPAFPGQLRNF